ncbi:class I SAM-dependent methyltransferase [Propionibacteriaceae bacterium G1746]|uniref:class I SAM-dependent methyltransferase n=1 Tax=Aestuariimicrobium sp. G57 TaxID=3418485 RepID=UPI003C14F00F
MTTHAFQVSGGAYNSFMGRYSKPLSPLFADFAGVPHSGGLTALDVGCGPGALTTELVARLGAEHVTAIDPSPGFVAECRAAHPAAVVHQASADSIPLADDTVDVALSQLVFHFIPDPESAVREQSRVVRPGGMIAACVWDYQAGMQLLRSFWDAALSLNPDAPQEARVLVLGAPGELTGLFSACGLVDVHEDVLRVASDYSSFDELWGTFLAGVGPAGAHTRALGDDDRSALRAALFDRLGRPEGGFTLTAAARAARGRVPAA